jgi:hypothetical protein
MQITLFWFFVSSPLGLMFQGIARSYFLVRMRLDPDSSGGYAGSVDGPCHHTKRTEVDDSDGMLDPLWLQLSG